MKMPLTFSPIRYIILPLSISYIHMNYSSAKTSLSSSLAKFASVLAFVAIAGVAVFTPAHKASALSLGNIVDPLCLWSGCGHSNPTTVVNNSNNHGNINSPGGTVNNGGTTVVGSVSNPVTTPVYIPVQTPVYTYNNNGNYNNGYYNNNNNNNYNTLSATCYASPTSIGVGQTMNWRVSAYGGNGGSYYYSWSGSDGLSGNGSNLSMSYNTPGTKNATVTVTSGGQTISRNCDTSVTVYDNYNNYNNNNNYYTNGSYYGNSSLTVSCIANTSFAPVGQNVQWTANASGGYGGGYTYRWTGTDGVSSYGSTMGVNYGTPGVKYASVTVYSSNNGQSVTQNCSGSVTVGVQNGQYYNNGNNTGNLQIACFADKNSARLGTSVTWAVEVTGGDGANYNYSWSGSDGLSGSQSTAVTSYGTTGTKNATVAITSGGYTASKLCGNSVYVTSGQTYTGGTTVVTPPQNQNDDSGFSAASLFSLKNVPWGWVAILVILVLFSMVMYLLFTRREADEIVLK
jgi:hypothetical protein